jgi:hypothetical protein
MPEREFELYLSVLSRLLRLSPQQKDSIADELRDHLEERFEDLVRSGISRDDAIRQALDEFGDAAGLAVDFTAVSKKRVRRLIMRSTAAITAVIAIVAFFVSDMAPQQPGVPALPGLAVAAAESDAPKETTPDETAVEEIPPEPLERISGPSLLPQELEQWTQLELIDTPLVDVAQFISELHDFPIVFDELALDESGIATDLPITLHIVEPPELKAALKQEDLTPDARSKLLQRYSDQLVSLHQALDWMLRPLDMGWYVEDDVLHLTSRNGEAERLITRSYPVRDLIRSGITAESLADTIQLMTSGEWEETDGGTGTLSLVGDVLTVRHSYQMQRQVESLLVALSNRSPWSYVMYPRRHVRQLEKLELLASAIEFQDAPLGDVIEYLSEVVGARIRVDGRRLAEEGISGDEPVSLVLPDRPLRTVLKLILEPLKLQTIVQDGVLTVTTRPAAEEDAALHTMAYDVHDLQRADEPVGVASSRLDALVEAIQKTTRTWVDIEGSGGELVTPGGGWLIVRQTDRTHAEIRELLYAQRRLLPEEWAVAAAEPQAPGSQKETRFYRVPSESAADLTTAILDLVAPATWKDNVNLLGGGQETEPSASGTIRKVAIGNRVVAHPAVKSVKPADAAQITTTVVSETVLIIQNTRAVHQQIDSFLHNLGLNVRGTAPRKAPKSGGGFY